jgi:hypothetical protein
VLKLEHKAAVGTNCNMGPFLPFTIKRLIAIRCQPQVIGYIFFYKK